MIIWLVIKYFQSFHHCFTKVITLDYKQSKPVPSPSLVKTIRFLSLPACKFLLLSILIRTSCWLLSILQHNTTYLKLQNLKKHSQLPTVIGFINIGLILAVRICILPEGDGPYFFLSECCGCFTHSKITFFRRDFKTEEQQLISGRVRCSNIKKTLICCGR